MDTRNHSIVGHTTGNGLSGASVNIEQIPQHLRHATFSSRGKFSMDLSARLSRITIKHDKPGARTGMPRTKQHLSKRSGWNKSPAYSVGEKEFTSALHAKLEKVYEEQKIVGEEDPTLRTIIHSLHAKLVKVREDQMLLEENDAMAPAQSSSHPADKGTLSAHPGKMLKDYKENDTDAAKKVEVNNGNNNDDPEELNSNVVLPKSKKASSNMKKTKKRNPAPVRRKDSTARSLSHTANKESTIKTAGDEEGETPKVNVRVTRAAARKQIHAIPRKTRATSMKQTRATAPKRTRARPTTATGETAMQSIANFTCKCGSDYILLASFLKHQKTCKMGMK